MLAEVRSRGPLGAGELADGEPGEGGWWGWSEASGRSSSCSGPGCHHATRRGFERVYDLPERVLPPGGPGAADAEPRRRSASSASPPGPWASPPRATCATTSASTPPTPPGWLSWPRLASFCRSTVEGWGSPACLDPAARLPRRVEARALLSPFDSLVWERARTERLFDFRYRLEIYTPAHKRRTATTCCRSCWATGWWRGSDLKTDRKAGCLRVIGTHIEPGVDERAVAGPLADELRLMADWLRLERVAAQ